ncbi:MAG: carbonic anhydrase, partial [Ilumatobacteraceae bacterium]
MTSKTSRISALVAAGGLVLALTACGDDDAADSAGSIDTTQAAGTTAAPAKELPHWTYEGEEGPENWGELAPEYVLCADGSAQTPIDITNTIDADLTDPLFSYDVNSATVINNGHTIQANAAEGNTLTVDGVDSPLKQIHFHAPSEHTIDGESAAAEVHFVHKTDDGVISVVGVMIVEDAAANTAWQPYVDAMGTVEGAETAIELDWAAMLPAVHTTYRYSGSLTTPPCTEGVNWFLMTESVSLSADQIAAITAAYEGNNR